MFRQIPQIVLAFNSYGRHFAAFLHPRCMKLAYGFWWAECSDFPQIELFTSIVLLLSRHLICDLQMVLKVVFGERKMFRQILLKFNFRPPDVVHKKSNFGVSLV